MQDIKEYENYVEQVITSLVGILPKIISAVLILVIGMWAVRFLNRMVRNFFLKKDYDPTLESFLQSFISISLKAILFVLVITQLGVQSSSLVAIVGAAGLAVGLALQGSLANFAGGVLILIFKPFKVGDFITAQGVDGTVKEITIFTTKLNTFGNQIAIVPNGQLSNNNIINYNSQENRRDKIVVGIGYSSDIKKAKEILLQICRSCPDILKEPAPEVFVENLGDSSVDLQLRFWARNEHFWPAHFAVLEELKYKFDAEGIEIPFPQRVIHSKTEPEKRV